jgi:hypothetical protein
MSDGRIPAGADVPWAPWNEPEVEYKEVEVTISLTISKTTKITVPDIKNLDSSILKEAVKEQIVLPHKVEFIKEISNESALDKRVIEDLSNWIEDDFEVVLEDTPLYYGDDDSRAE